MKKVFLAVLVMVLFTSAVQSRADIKIWREILENCKPWRGKGVSPKKAKKARVHALKSGCINEEEFSFFKQLRAMPICDSEGLPVWVILEG